MNDEVAEPRREHFRNVGNPFATGTPTQAHAGALASAEQQRSVAEVQARMIIARANPRNPVRAMDLILQDCTRPTLAEGALYQYSRGGSSISGPSIRLAEAIAQRWGNIASGIKEVGRAGGYSECVAYAWDLESGYYDERQFQVRHWRDTRAGGHPLTDERDIYELIANMGQRRKRAVMLTVIPGDVVEAAVYQCEQTLSTTADTSPEALARIAAAFETFGVTRAQLEKRCQCRLEAIRPAQVVQLRKIYASIKDGMSDAKDWFDAPDGVWAAADAAHAANPAAPTARSETRKAPRKSTAKEAAPPPAQEPAQGDGLPFDRWDETAAKMDTPRQNQPARAEDAVPSVAAPAPSGAVPFSAWLIDGEGVEMADADGVVDQFTDPVAYARAFVAARDTMFPGDVELFERANHDELRKAMIASAEVAAILVPKKDASPPRAASMTGQVPLTVDKLTPPVVKEYLESLKTTLATTTTNEAVDHIRQVNMPNIERLPPSSGRLPALQLIEARRKELSGASEKPATAETLAMDLVHDIHSLVAVESFDAWIEVPTTQKALATLRTEDPIRHTQVLAAYKSAKLLMMVRATATSKECDALQENPAVIDDAKWLATNAGLTWHNVNAEAKRHKVELVTKEAKAQVPA